MFKTFERFFEALYEALEKHLKGETVKDEDLPLFEFFRDKIG